MRAWSTAERGTQSQDNPLAEHWWKEWGATGKLLPGALPYRANEVIGLKVFDPTAR
jgi:hypothetical protein